MTIKNEGLSKDQKEMINAQADTIGRLIIEGNIDNKKIEDIYKIALSICEVTK